MSTGFVYILESPSHEDLAANRSEGVFTSALAGLLGWQVVRRTVATPAHLANAGREFNSAAATLNPFDFLLVSAHGCDSGIQLSDGTLVPWEDFWPSFGPAVANATVILSSCSVLKHDRLRRFLEKTDFAPCHLIGFREDVDWSGAAVAVAMVMRVLHGSESVHEDEDSGNTSFVRLLNCYAAVWQLLDVDIQALRFCDGGSSGVMGRYIAFSNLIDTDHPEVIDADFVVRWDVADRINELAHAGITREQFLAEHTRRAREAYVDPATPGVSRQFMLDLARRVLDETCTSLMEKADQGDRSENLLVESDNGSQAS